MPRSGPRVASPRDFRPGVSVTIGPRGRPSQQFAKQKASGSYAAAADNPLRAGAGLPHRGRPGRARQPSGIGRRHPGRARRAHHAQLARSPPRPRHQPARRTDPVGRRTGRAHPSRHRQNLGPEQQQPPLRRPLGRRHPAVQTRRAPHIPQRYAEEVFWIALDPATYRSLTLGRGLSPSSYETWIRNFYERMLLQ